MKSAGYILAIVAVVAYRSPVLCAVLLASALALWITNHTSARAAVRPAGAEPAEMHWLGPGQEAMVHGCRIADALTYSCPGPPAIPEASCIDLSLPVGRPIVEPKGALGYWPQYAEISPRQRANYLRWLAGGRKAPLDDIGYAFIYFYGLERRALVEDQDHELILEEAVRLLDQYGQSASFARYAGAFFEYVSARHGLEHLDERWFEVLAAHASIPVTLAWLAVQERPLPVEMACAVAERAALPRRDDVPKKARERLWKLFAQRYQERFGDGLKLGAADRPHLLKYKPASPTLLHSPTGLQARAPVGIPDVLGLASQFRSLVELRAECAEELLAGLAGLRPAEPTTPQQEPIVLLDMARVQRLFSATAEVQRLLAGAMEAEEPEGRGVSATADLREESKSRDGLAQNTPLAPVVSPHPLEGLNERYHPVVAKLLARDEWHPQEVDTLARKYGFMRSGMLEVINEWAIERFGDSLIDDQQVPHVTRRDLLERAQ